MAFVVDGDAGVEDDILSDGRAGLHHAASEDLRALADGDAGGHISLWVDQSHEFVAFFAELFIELEAHAGGW